MKLKINKIAFLIFVLILIGNTLAQNVWGPEQTTLRRDLNKNYSGETVFSNGLADLYTNFYIGCENVIFKRVVYQWEITDTDIPDNSTITNVTLSFNYSKNGHSFELPTDFHSISYDIENPDQTQLRGMWNEMGTTNIGYMTGENNVMNFVSNNSNNPFNLAIRNALPNNKFILGIKFQNENTSLYRTWFINNWTVSLTIEYIPPQQSVTLYQRLSNNTQVGKLRKWEGTEFTQSPYIDPGTPFIFPVGSPQTIKGDQAVYSNEKYQKWIKNSSDEQNVANHHSFTIQPNDFDFTSKFNPTQSGITIKNNLEETGVDGGSVQFKDPWFIDFADPSFGNTLRNRGMDEAIFHDRYSSFYPNTSTTYENGQKYNGVFLDQSGPQNDWEGSYYSVGSPTEQIIQLNGIDHKFFFKNWSGTDVTFQSTSTAQTGAVFTSGSAAATANLKGQLISNESNGFSGNGQRKIVRDNSGYYHCVYSSQDVVWYTKSTTTNFDGNWTQDAEIFLNNAYDKNPSMDVNGNDFAVVAELQDGNYAAVYLYRNDSSPVFEVALIDNSLYGSSYPVISKTNNELFIVYKTSVSSPLKYRRYYQNSSYPYTWGWAPEADLPYSTSNSKYPSIVGNKSNDDVYVVWQEGNSEIKYLYSHRQGNNRTFYSADFQSVSGNCGYTYNTNPSISLSYNVPVVSWTGSRKESVVNKILGKETGFAYVYRALIRTKASSWGDFTVVGSGVGYTNNNSSASNTGETVIAFSQSNGQSSKWLNRVGGYYSAVSSLSHNGLLVNVSNGASIVNQKAMVFNTTSLPYPINRSTTSFSSLEKITSDTSITYGRTGIVGKQGMEFLFCAEDILLDDENIKFTARVDTLTVLNLNELNSIAKTNTFNLTGNSDLYFSLYYLVINPELASSVLTNEDYVSFKLELVNADNNSVVGTFDDITFTKQNVYDHENISYKIDCTGIEAGNYYLRIVADANSSTGLSITNNQNDAEQLGKKQYTEIYYTGNETPKEYALAQNYPNPFNPSTTIRYQLPKDGMVTLKIYDILGSEVATLVNQEKIAGKYEVNFNASSVASGVYIYRISSGSFSASKKLMLLK